MPLTDQSPATAAPAAPNVTVTAYLPVNNATYGLATCPNTIASQNFIISWTQANPPTNVQYQLAYAGSTAVNITPTTGQGTGSLSFVVHPLTNLTSNMITWTVSTVVPGANPVQSIVVSNVCPTTCGST